MINKSYKKKTYKQKPKVSKWLFWTPRILAIIFILFLMLFSLDIFDMQLGFWGTIAGLFMHNLPALILLVVLIISWKHEIVGGLVFILTGLTYITMLLVSVLRGSPHEWIRLFWSLPIAGPALIVGVLFLIGWFRKKRN